MLLAGNLSANAADPKITKEAGKTTLSLPPDFLAAIQAEFPEYRVPNESDLTYYWATQSLPYIAWGDFNGDGLIDIAVLLIKDGGWKEVIMHKTGQGYVPGLVNDGVIVHFSIQGGVHSHQELIIRTIPANEVTPCGRNNPFSHNLDSLMISVVEQAGEIFFWSNGSYQSVHCFTE